MLLSVFIAVAGAFTLALGSALQERDAVRAPGRQVARAGFLLHLLRQPRWLIGSGAAVLGACLHLIALSGAPLTIIQPIGVTGLLFAIVLSAAFNRQRVRVSQILAGIAVMVGLVGVLVAFPHGTDLPVLSTGTALWLAGGVAAAGLAVYLTAHWMPSGMRALMLAAAGGAALGTTSGLARVITANAVQDPLHIFSWLTLLAGVTAVFGALLLQNAYRTGHFAAAYATLLIADPVVGVGIGALLLGEGVPDTPVEQVGAALFALLAFAGTVALARSRHRNPEADGGPAFTVGVSTSRTR
ncbi:DMT family transporter [Nocardiopsis metallicus]|uniref:Drug/metabolite transporter (DMT)-like permease n=1 Tax=Nocardiopsis metallicus TaxID=179819 RepID=A0A840VYY7_9ACTN|nr:DMT family transporter [Nocardiopsis metallicus]MBB5488934.1 drug/metabolite transporter (DMT)-like permease [Nocardiopsis metallicus]